MDAVVLRGRRRLLTWVILLLILIGLARVFVIFLAWNGREHIPAQLLADVIAAAVVLYVAFCGRRVEKWLGVLLFAVWGLNALRVAIDLGGLVSMSIRGEMTFLLVGGAWGTVVRTLGVLTALACWGFAVSLVWSPSINRYFAFRRAQRNHLLTPQ